MDFIPQKAEGNRKMALENRYSPNRSKCDRTRSTVHNIDYDNWTDYIIISFLLLFISASAQPNEDSRHRKNDDNTKLENHKLSAQTEPTHSIFNWRITSRSDHTQLLLFFLLLLLPRRRLLCTHFIHAQTTTRYRVSSLKWKTSQKSALLATKVDVHYEILKRRTR